MPKKKAPAAPVGMKIEMWPIGKPIPYDRNPREIPESAVDKVAASINEFGFRQPIVVDKKRVIIAGHTRLMAAQQLGLKEVPVHVATNLTVAQVKPYRLADNRTNDEASWNNEMLALELKELNIDDFDLDLTGFDLDEINSLLCEKSSGLTDEDEAPPVETFAITEPGDLWILGSHRLLCGDSTSIDAVERLMNGQKADMVFTDPPYGIDEKTDRQFASMTRLAEGGKFAKIIGDKSTESAMDAYALCESLKVQTMIFWGANHYAHGVPESPSWIVWDKRCDDKERDMNSDAELAWVKTSAKSVRVFRHVWKGIIKDSEHGQKRVHPTQKPVALAEWCFEEYGCGLMIFSPSEASGLLPMMRNRNAMNCGHSACES